MSKKTLSYGMYNEIWHNTFEWYEMLISSMSSYSFVTEMVSIGNIEQNHKKTLTSSKINKLWIITLAKSFQGHFEYWKVISVNQKVNEPVAWQG